ncbi:unnamed protein product [Taenia asiatica]|uniref:Uncharacterized protein n=1 Tax=Taenia asiatica TaxID=60517 RepID=A0A0R3W655_TAEAS|nr:unnamed protein product [Taenia asiatica]
MLRTTEVTPAVLPPSGRVRDGAAYRTPMEMSTKQSGVVSPLVGAASPTVIHLGGGGGGSGGGGGVTS